MNPILKPSFITDKLRIKTEQLNTYDETLRYVPRAITIHSTAGGSVEGAVAHWNTTPVKEGTPFLIDRDGSIYVTYDWQKYWTWHLGINNSYYDKACVGIELVNWLMLKKGHGDTGYVTWPKNFTNPYSGPEPVRSKFRGFEFWEPYPEAQMEAAIWLCAWLCEEYSIDRNVMGAPTKLYSPMYNSLLGGINTHQQFRADKFDVGPAFDWGKFEDGLRSFK